METKYQNLINYIQEQISDGQLGPGEKVPSENQLSEQFHISRQTVRKAIGTLGGGRAGAEDPWQWHLCEL
ncbi:MAG: GntR family transcriptional regulator [Waltera sp.]